MKNSKPFFTLFFLSGIVFLFYSSCGDICHKADINLKLDLFTEATSVTNGEPFEILYIIENITNLKEACNKNEGDVTQTHTEVIVERANNASTDFDIMEERIIPTAALKVGEKIENNVSFQFDHPGNYRIVLTSNIFGIEDEKNFDDNIGSIIIEVTD